MSGGSSSRQYRDFEPDRSQVVEPLTAAEREELDYAWSHRAGRIPANGLRLLRQLEQVEADREGYIERHPGGGIPDEEEEAREYTACHPDCRADAGAGLHHRECQVADAD